MSNPPSSQLSERVGQIKAMEEWEGHRSQRHTEDSREDIIYSYFFGVELTADEREYSWSEGKNRDQETQSAGNESAVEEELVEESYAVSKVLSIRQVALGANAKPGERNVLELWSHTTENEPVNYSIAVLTCGKREMECLHLNFDNVVPVTLKLSAGSGPLVVTGQMERRLSYDPDYSPNDTITESTSSESSYEEINPDEEVKPKPDVVDAVEMQKEILWQKFLKNKIVFAAETGRCETGETSSAKREASVRQYPRFKDGYAVRSRQHPAERARLKELNSNKKNSDTTSSSAARKINL